MFSQKEGKETEKPIFRMYVLGLITLITILIGLWFLNLNGTIDLKQSVKMLTNANPNYEQDGLIYSTSITDDFVAIESYVGPESTVIIPDELKGKKVKIIKDNAFKGNSKINYVKLPSNLESIGNDVFKDCITLREVIFNDSIDSIGDSAFAGCSSIKIINIPRGVKIIGKDEFIGCYKLDTVNIPMEVTQLGGSTFTRLSYFNKEIVGETSYQFTSEDGISFTRKIN